MLKKIGIFLCTVLIVLGISGACSKVSAANLPSVSSDAAVLIETTTSKVLYDKNANAKMEPASITKIMTAILTIENSNLNDMVTVPLEAVSHIPEGYSIAELLPNEQLTVDQLLQLLMVYSANDAANVLAFHMDGSIEQFANRMNAKMQELGIQNSHFTNPSGMHDENHYSTAYDIALLMQYCIKNPTFKKYASLKSCKIAATNLSSERTFTNTNPMLNPESSYYYEPLVATKTGFTTPAQYCLASYAIDNDISMVCVLLHSAISKNRFSDTKQLFSYGAEQFSFQEIAKKGDVVTQITVQNATPDTQFLDIVVNESLRVLAKNGSVQVAPQITLPDIPAAPIAQGTVLGTATYVIDDTSYSVQLVASHDVLLKTSNIYYLLIIGLVIIVSALVLICTLGRKKEKN